MSPPVPIHLRPATLIPYLTHSLHSSQVFPSLSQTILTLTSLRRLTKPKLSSSQPLRFPAAPIHFLCPSFLPRICPGLYLYCIVSRFALHHSLYCLYLHCWPVVHTSIACVSPHSDFCVARLLFSWFPPFPSFCHCQLFAGWFGMCSL